MKFSAHLNPSKCTFGEFKKGYGFHTNTKRD